jgi:hypothetical protein
MPRTKRPTYAELKKKAHNRDTDELGCRIWDYYGKEVGLSLGPCGVYTGPAGFSTRCRVLWPDGKTTVCNCKGIIWKNRRWIINGGVR